jgi:hypothetical protein
MNNINDFLVNNCNDFKNFTVICEDFYNNPFSVFKQSIETGYPDNWPYGTRTATFNIHDCIKSNIIKYLPHFTNNNLNGEFTGVSGSFLKNLKNANGIWNHVDSSPDDTTRWAAVIYTHPFPNINAGTSLNSYVNTSYKYINSYSPVEMIENKNDINRWFKNIYIGNTFNKLVIYPGGSFHTLASHFGHTLYNCRITNTFFTSSI